MVQLKRVDSEFTTPKVRDSFTNQFVWNETGEPIRHGYSALYANTLLTHLDGRLNESLINIFRDLKKLAISGCSPNLRLKIERRDRKVAKYFTSGMLANLQCVLC